MHKLNFSEIYEKFLLEALDIEVDLVVAVSKGGVVPAAILSVILQKEMKTLTKPLERELAGKKVLLVDDFSLSGETIEKAKQLLIEKGASEVRTLVVAGKDALFPAEEHVELPWTSTKTTRDIKPKE